MSSCPEVWRSGFAALLLTGLSAAALAQATPQAPYPGVGRTATPKEVAAWDIDVRPDFKGLPKGSGSVSKGQDVWEAKCASCHGIFGESNEVFSPLVGGTTKEDVKTGRVARLNDVSFPGRTTLMKVPTLSTLWDYINRAMPWTAPKTLTTEEVYAVTAYMLNLGGVVPDNYVLSHSNMAATQNLLPNRNGMTTNHHLWPGKTMGKADGVDVRTTACMKNCDTEPKVASFLPDHARNNHGNLAEQQRPVGPQRGADTTRPPSADAAKIAMAAAAVAPKSSSDSPATQALALAQKHNCTACHGVDTKIVGPGLREIGAKYASQADAAAYLVTRITAGGTGVWGQIPMPPQTLPEADAKAIAQWLASGAKK